MLRPFLTAFFSPLPGASVLLAFLAGRSSPLALPAAVLEEAGRLTFTPPTCPKHTTKTERQRRFCIRKTKESCVRHHPSHLDGSRRRPEGEALGHVTQVQAAHHKDVLEVGGVGGVGPDEGLERRAACLQELRVVLDGRLQALLQLAAEDLPASRERRHTIVKHSTRSRLHSTSTRTSPCPPLTSSGARKREKRDGVAAMRVCWRERGEGWMPRV